MIILATGRRADLIHRALMFYAANGGLEFKAAEALAAGMAAARITDREAIDWARVGHIGSTTEIDPEPERDSRVTQFIKQEIEK